MPKLLLALLALCLLLGLAAISSDTCAAPESNRLVQMGAPQAVGDRDDAVRAEIAALGEHAWAGEYYFGDGLGANVLVSLAPTAGVVATWTGCLGLYGSNEGIVEPQANGSLKLAFHEPNRKGFGGFADRLQPVTWGERHYLIAADDIEDFIGAINFGDEPRQDAHGFFLLRRGDEEKPVEGFPDLPARALAHLRHEPLVVRPAAVTLIDTEQGEDWCTKVYRIDFARGSDDGLVERVRLRAVKYFERIAIAQAGARHATAEMHRGDKHCADIVAPDTSWEFSTGAYRTER